MKLKPLILLLFAIATLSLQTTSGQIRFSEMSIQAGITTAKEKGKFLFVDTYAEWCIPCKKMKTVFADKDVAAYFNDHYINIRINMDTPRGKETYAKYDVVFLPTMMIFDGEGIIKYKTDKLMSAQELLNIGIQANVEGVYLGDNASKIVSNPFNNKKKKPAPKNTKSERSIVAKKSDQNNTSDNTSIKESDTAKSEAGNIVYVLGSDLSNAPPEILYKESYFRMQLMDGSHRETAIAYLNTQSDWNTDKNIKFIYDFIETTDSPLFEYMISHRSRFENLVGAESVKQSIRILVNQRISQGFPRPNLSEAKKLYSYINVQNAHQLAYQYYLTTLEEAENFNVYEKTATEYLTQISPEDHYIIYKLVNQYLEFGTTKNNLDKYINLMGKAIDLKENEPYYYLSLAKLYIKKGDFKKAKKITLEAQNILSENSENLSFEINNLLSELEKN